MFLDRAVQQSHLLRLAGLARSPLFEVRFVQIPSRQLLSRKKLVVHENIAFYDDRCLIGTHAIGRLPKVCDNYAGHELETPWELISFQKPHVE